MAGETLLDVHDVRRSFPRPGGGELLVLDGVELNLKQGEIVGLLGRSGSGKSTLLRLIAGLARPQGGTLSYMGHPIDGPASGIAMVFQSFALFPWLTVLENVQLGLEAMNIPAAEIRKRALDAIDLIGLDGYENAYPRELSGGMRQRVGFARALVVHPNILLMDEPFSALDVLTAENLRTDLVELWSLGQLPIKGMILVTHNIEEAVLMCDRVLLFSTNPGRIAGEIRIDIPRPRDRSDPRFEAYVDRIYTEMTARQRTARERGAGLDTLLTHVSPNLVSGLIEAVAAAPYGGKADLPDIASDLQMEIDELFPVAEALQILKLGDLEGGDLKLSHMGKRFADAELNERKEIFYRALMNNVPLAAHIRRVLDERASHTAPRRRFVDELEDHMTEDAAEETLKTIISWGRFSELFAYDDESEMFSLENPT
ncbi:MAG TPA: nitrate/sulfonate/bicarbonate ABC transporter ATP-binding protein [Rhizomicrobium sp.]|nr:nitrate/sulfonate/bicarbonate ABC transporter ATP-binding protein [Rhizomicrobium sp.]